MNIDLHAHILPKADHGSDGMTTSLSQVALAQEAGVDVLAATPHFYPMQDSIDGFLRRREACYAALQAQLPAKSPKILLGAEVQLCRGLENLEQLPELCYEGTNVLLLELPPVFQPKLYERTLEALLYERGLTVLLAHIDRYDARLIDRLLAEGCLAQLNASAFCHFLSKRSARRRVEEGSVWALGSDLHGTQTGYTEYLRAKQSLGSTYDLLMQKSRELLGL